MVLWIPMDSITRMLLSILLIVPLATLKGHSFAKMWPIYAVTVKRRDYGRSKLTFHNSTHLTQQFISSETGEVLDEATLYKDHGLNW
jgi:hypothetical protein